MAFFSLGRKKEETKQVEKSTQNQVEKSTQNQVVKVNNDKQKKKKYTKEEKMAYYCGLAYRAGVEGQSINFENKLAKSFSNGFHSVDEKK